MTLPVSPDAETILAACVETLRDVVVPNVEGEWPRYSADLLVGALEYVLQLLREDHDGLRREELATAIETVRGLVASEPEPQWSAALEAASPFEAASRLLVAGQNHPGPVADGVRGVLHPVLKSQLDAEFARSMGLFLAFVRNMTSGQ
jgi:hypothetical protein